VNFINFGVLVTGNMIDNAKVVKIDVSSWEKIRAEAYRRRMTIKAVLGEILEGRLDPTTLTKRTDN
jgi:hypothetical protein